MRPVVRSPDGDERLAELPQGRLTGVPDVLFAHQDPHQPPSSSLLKERTSARAARHWLGDELCALPDDTPPAPSAASRGCALGHVVACQQR